VTQLPPGGPAAGAGGAAESPPFAPEVPAIELRNVRFSFAGHPVLNGVSLAIPKGEVFGVMGMSGCGKSTLLKLIMGLLQPDSGEVLVKGRSIVGLHERELNEVRRTLGMCFQYAALFDSMTVGENVAFGLRRHTRMKRAEIADAVAECLDRVGMTGSEELYPSELSGGMRKRVGIARALALQPEVMLYDEPSSGLDPIVASVIDGLILHLADDLGVTSVVVSHHVRNLFSVADRVVMLYDHRVEQLASPAELQANGTEVVRQFVHGQPTGPIIV
jgi:phospholipid/cholesterol/gamma-HCH transport system ATP-binding protein